MTALHIAPKLALPLDAVTQTFGVLAKRGAGKTYTGAVLCEEFLKAKQQVIVVDPIGVWWGLRSSADGKSEGFGILIFGGEHADVPLEETGGKVAADFAIDTGQSVILDLSLFRKGAQIRFMTDFAEQLYHRNRAAVHVVIDEADAFAPQKPQKGIFAERLLGAIEDLVRRGRARGIGLTLITQRSAVLNKNVLTQIEVLIALRTTAPQDVAAIRAWVDYHEAGELSEKLMLESLPSLPIGDAWVWSPGWLDVFRRVHIRERQTFDSSRTPKAGEKRREPKAIAAVDLAKLSKEMLATAERAKENDPKQLRARILELEKAAKAKVAAPAPAKPSAEELTKIAERARAQVKREYGRRLANLDGVVRRIGVAYLREEKSYREHEKAMGILLNEAADAIGLLHSELPEPPIEIVPPASPPATSAARHAAPEQIARAIAPAAAPRAPRLTAPNDDVTVSPSEQRILDAVAAFEQLGISPVKRVNAAFFAGYTENGHFNNMCGRLRTVGFLDYPTGGTIALTDAGRAIANPASHPIRSRDDLLQTWLGKLSPSEGKLLLAVAPLYPEPISRAALAEATGYTENGHFNNMLGHLRTLGVIDYPHGGHVVATDVLFPEGLA